MLRMNDENDGYLPEDVGPPSAYNHQLRRSRSRNNSSLRRRTAKHLSGSAAHLNWASASANPVPDPIEPDFEDDQSLASGTSSFSVSY